MASPSRRTGPTRTTTASPRAAQPRSTLRNQAEHPAIPDLRRANPGRNRPPLPRPGLGASDALYK
jgi:hypothetical protein